MPITLLGVLGNENVQFKILHIVYKASGCNTLYKCIRQNSKNVSVCKILNIVFSRKRFYIFHLIYFIIVCELEKKLMFLTCIW